MCTSSNIDKLLIAYIEEGLGLQFIKLVSNPSFNFVDGIRYFDSQVALPADRGLVVSHTPPANQTAPLLRQ